MFLDIVKEIVCFGHCREYCVVCVWNSGKQRPSFFCIKKIASFCVELITSLTVKDLWSLNLKLSNKEIYDFGFSSVLPNSRLVHIW